MNLHGHGGAIDFKGAPHEAFLTALGLEDLTCGPHSGPPQTVTRS